MLRSIPFDHEGKKGEAERDMTRSRLTASIVIATRNRKEELRNTIASAVSQTIGAEVLIIDDGSTDGTSEMVCSEFPQVRFIRCEEARGYIARRNEGARLAAGDVVISIDDDAVFSTPHIIEETLRDFNLERVGAVAIPYIDVSTDTRLRQMAPDSESVYISNSYIGTAHAVRLDVFLRLGGYREHFVHQGEEEDYCIRMLNAGYVVRLGTADPIHHFESPKRDFSRRDFYGARNAVLFAWQNVPFPPLLVHLPATSIRCLLFTLRPNRFKTRLAGLIDGYIAILRRCWERRPVSVSVYLLHRKVKKAGRYCTLQEMERRLPILMRENRVAETETPVPLER